MRLGRLTGLIVVLGASAIGAQRQDAWIEPYQPISQRLIAEARSSDFTWRRLAELTDTFGHRLSGSESLERAIDWAVATLKADGLENVRTEPVMRSLAAARVVRSRAPPAQRQWAAASE